MSLQIIKSIEGKAEYVLLPVKAYRILKNEIDKVLESKDIYEDFELEDYVSNPVALARIKANLTQEELAKKLKVTQAYISKLESRENVTAKMLEKVMKALYTK